MGLGLGLGLGVRVRSARPAKAVVGVVGAAAFRRVGLRVRWALHGGLAVAGVVVAEGLIEVDDLLDADLLAEIARDRDERSGIGGEERGEIVGDLLETRTWSR